MRSRRNYGGHSAFIKPGIRSPKDQHRRSALIYALAAPIYISWPVSCEHPKACQLVTIIIAPIFVEYLNLTWGRGSVLKFTNDRSGPCTATDVEIGFRLLNRSIDQWGIQSNPPTFLIHLIKMYINMCRSSEEEIRLLPCHRLITYCDKQLNFNIFNSDPLSYFILISSFEFGIWTNPKYKSNIVTTSFNLHTHLNVSVFL